jgi:hypothetical protein
MSSSRVTFRVVHHSLSLAITRLVDGLPPLRHTAFVARSRSSNVPNSATGSSARSRSASSAARPQQRSETTRRGSTPPRSRSSAHPGEHAGSDSDRAGTVRRPACVYPESRRCFLLSAPRPTLQSRLTRPDRTPKRLVGRGARPQNAPSSTLLRTVSLLERGGPPMSSTRPDSGAATPRDRSAAASRETRSLGQSTATIASMMTGTFSGEGPCPGEERAWRPASPQSATIRSLKPLVTAAFCPKPGAQWT